MIDRAQLIPQDIPAQPASASGYDWRTPMQVHNWLRWSLRNIDLSDQDELYLAGLNRKGGTEMVAGVASLIERARQTERRQVEAEHRDGEPHPIH